MSLTPDQKFNCSRCSATDFNVYTDDILQKFITWLETVTCIKWIRSHPELDRPDEPGTEAIKGQYGVIEILASTLVKQFDPTNNEEGFEPPHEFIGCFDLNSEHNLTIQLDVYRENGDPNRDQMGTQEAVHPIGSAIDVHWRIMDRYKVPRLKALLKNDKITIDSWGTVEWNKEERNQTWENVATQQIQVRICRKSSIAGAQIKCIELQICEHDPELLCDVDKFEPCE
jgi:hypothetical protein